MRARVPVPFSTTSTRTRVKVSATQGATTRRTTRGRPKRTGRPSGSRTSLTKRGSMSSPPLASTPNAMAICKGVTASS